MGVQLKPVHEQVMVITGASSGIGLTTARMAAARGASVVVAGRNAETLGQLADEINTASGSAVAVTADVGDAQAVQRIADVALQAFGRIDTWVNNAGVSIYGTFDQVDEADARRLFDTNFWGTVHGSRAAVEAMKHAGGALINIGSTVGDRSVPLQSYYCASKAAIKGFTDSVRMEVEKAGYPISVTLVKPAAIDTPYPRHAKNLMDVEPTHPPPVYKPEMAAETILYVAQHPRRDIFVGTMGLALSTGDKVVPRLVDKLMEVVIFKQQRSDVPTDPNRRDGLHGPGDGGSQSGGFPGTVRPSLYTEARLHPLVSGSVLAALGVGIAGVVAAIVASPHDGD